MTTVGPAPPLAVHTSEGQVAGTEQGKADVIKECVFEKLFTGPDDEPLLPFAGDPHIAATTNRNSRS